MAILFLVWGERFGGNADIISGLFRGLFAGLFVGEKFLGVRFSGLLKGEIGFDFGDSTFVGSSKKRSRSSF